MHLPTALQTPDNTPALALLHRYFGDPFAGAGAAVAAAFDHWDSAGTRTQDVNRFTADDLVAVSFLSVDVPPTAARVLLRDRSDEFSELLAAIGPDRDLADEQDPLPDDWSGWALMHALRELEGVHTTKASKLLARKRPRLRPIWDNVVAKVTDAVDNQWEPLRQLLRADDLALHQRLLRLRTKAGLPKDISALRVFDVVCWREGKDLGL